MFSIFRKKPFSSSNASAAPSKSHNKDASYKTPEFAARLQRLLFESKFVYRDVNLKPEVIRLYQPGLFFREPTLFDTTHRFGGPTGNTRFLVVTSTPRDMSMVSETPEWGLCTFPPNELFKIIDVMAVGSLTQVTVLHIPADCEFYFRSADSSFFENQLTPQTCADFHEAIRAEKISIHTSASWRQRTMRPPGVDVRGTLTRIHKN